MNNTLLVVFGALLVVVIFVTAARSRNSPSRSQSTEQDVLDAIKDGYKVEAIKHYRYVHGVGLKEAKEAVERIGKDGL